MISHAHTATEGADGPYQLVMLWLCRMTAALLLCTLAIFAHASGKKIGANIATEILNSAQPITPSAKN